MISTSALAAELHRPALAAVLAFAAGDEIGAVAAVRSVVAGTAAQGDGLP